MNTDPLTAPTPSWWQRFVVGRRPKWTLLRLVFLIIAAVILFRVVLIPIQVQGISMMPTYRNGQINFINRLAYKWRPIQRGDVVGVRYAGRQVMLLKRVIGLPGERIAIKRGIVFINGEPLDEPYVRNPRARWYDPKTGGSINIGHDEYFIVGDNREMHQDLHDYGKVKGDRIIGKVLF